jgi:DNA-binding SARP family transcriptional activator
MSRLRIQSLGSPHVLIDGQNVIWHAESAQELFYYLLAHPEGSHRDTILENLWQEAPSSSVSNRFRVAIHRVRAALGGADMVLEDHGRYRLHPDVLCASDVYTFYAALDRAEHAPTTEAQLEAYQHALRLYQGDFLANEQAEWATVPREELRGSYARAEIELSMLHCDRGQCRASVSALVRALRADPFIGENHHQKLMACLSVIEDRYAAIEHYRRFLAFLREELDDTPMAETRELAVQIKDGAVICQRQHGRVDLSPTRICPFTPETSCTTMLQAIHNSANHTIPVA